MRGEEIPELERSEKADGGGGSNGGGEKNRWNKKSMVHTLGHTLKINSN